MNTTHGWYRIPVNGTTVQAYTDHARAAHLGGEPCPAPEDVPARVAAVDGLLESRCSLRDELPRGHFLRERRGR